MVTTAPHPSNVEDTTLKIKSISISSNNLNITYSGIPVAKCDDNCIKSAWIKANSVNPNTQLIAYACGTPCGAWGIKANNESTRMLNGINEIITPWVTTLGSDNLCTKTNSINTPDTISDYLNEIKGCIEKWQGTTYLSIGGWAEGYTFNQSTEPNTIVSYDKGPIKSQISCFDSNLEICQDHPSTKILTKGKNWGYWCFEKSSTDIIVEKSGTYNKGIECDGGTLKQFPNSCWDIINDTKGSPTSIEAILNYAKSKNYNGIDIDYEPNGSINNQAFDGYYIYKISYEAFNQFHNVVNAPLNNFFLDNSEWTFVNYNYFSEGGDLKKNNKSEKGYRCEGPGGYGSILFNLHYNKIFLNNLFIQFYNNPPGLCDATTTTNYCITSGTTGEIDKQGGKYYTIGPACSGGSGKSNLGSDETILLQCNYKENKKTPTSPDAKGWAYENNGYTYSGDTYPNMAGNYSGDPLGYFVEKDNPWLITTEEDDKLWQVESSYSNQKSDNSDTFMIGGIRNTISIILLAKAYHPEALISFGTVPPSGGNSGNLSTKMIQDIFRYLNGLQNAIDNDIMQNKQSPILNFLMMNLYKNNRLQFKPMIENIDPTLNDDQVNSRVNEYWKTYWGGVPGKSMFCTKYPGYNKKTKLFGGIGAWSVYWTELAKGSDNTDGTSSTWIESLKSIFDVTELNDTTLKGKECVVQDNSNVSYCNYEGNCYYGQTCISNGQCKGYVYVNKNGIKTKKNAQPSACQKVQGQPQGSPGCEFLYTE